jgi:hypothetical protein
MLYRGPFPAPFYRALHRLVHAEYRLNKIWRRRQWGRLPWGLYEALRWARARLGLEPYLRRAA